MRNWQERFALKEQTLEGAVELVGKGQHIFVGSGAAAPQGLIRALVDRASSLADNRVDHILTLGDAPYVLPEFEDQFRHNAFFIGANVRDAVREGRADYTPVFLSQIPDLIRRRRVEIDVALIQVSPPDEHGFVNLGVSVDVVLAAVQAAEVVIAEVNPNMPVVFGDGFIHVDQITVWASNPCELPTLWPQPIDEVAREIGRNVASLIQDGSTIQVGIGQIPDATIRALTNKKDLGVWTEMLSDGVVELVDAGVVTGKHKTIEPGQVSASFAMGSSETYRSLHRNPTYRFHPSDYINDPLNIAKQHRMVAINTALQVDLTGQVCADSIGMNFYSGIGGQVDFIRGASMCPGGRPIIALRSTAKGGQVSRIAAYLYPGSGVVTSRGDVHYVVTEYGIADLHGRSVRERAMALMSIAHPDFRSELLAAAKEQRYVFSDQICPRASYRREHEYHLRHADFGQLVIRPLRETDEPKMRDLFYSLSQKTIQHRWLGSITTMSHAAIQRYLQLDDSRNVALVIETQPDRERESILIGVGRYHQDPSSGWADVALLIADEYQGKGLGRILLDRLVGIARTQGVKGFQLETLTTNAQLFGSLRSSGLPMRSREQGEMTTVEIPLAS